MMNQCTFVGRLARDPSLYTTQNGVDVCNVCIAVSRKFKKSDDTIGEHVDYFECEAWDKGGNMIHTHFRKGNWITLYCSAKNHRLKVETVDGEKEITTTKFRINSFDFPSWNDNSRQRKDENVEVKE